MTVDAFERAVEIKAEIKSIDKILNQLSLFTYECLPPTRMTNVDMTIDHNDSINLNEGEVIAFRDALESKKAVLLREFGKL